MVLVQAHADVLSTCACVTPRLLTSDLTRIHVTQDTSVDRRVVLALLATLDIQEREVENRETEPDRKRQRTEVGHFRIVHDGGVEPTDSIVLAKVSLNLNLPMSSQEFQAETVMGDIRGDAPRTVHLRFDTFHELESNAFRIVLRSQSVKTGVEIVAVTQPAVLALIKPHLYIASRLAVLTSDKKSNSALRAAFCHSTLHLCPENPNSHRLDVEIRYKVKLSVVEHPSVTAKNMKEDLRLLSRYFPELAAQSDTKWDLSDFYESVYVPPADLHVSPWISKSMTETLLYPFQQRAVDWLLRREGVAFTSTGDLEPCVKINSAASFRQTQDALGSRCYVSQLRGMVVDSLNDASDDAIQRLHGGILAEEMGLGKTVELIALMSLHKRKFTTEHVWDLYSGTQVKPTSATLIITPPSILEQWISELQSHTPELKVLHYKGLPPPSAPQEEHALGTIEHLLRFDVVITTYHVLSREIHHATPPPDRSFRHAKRHERRMSPLVGISWWRVCLDEAQMVESGVSQAAKVAKIIPRCNAWAVTGTPLRKDVQDLRGLLIFLRCDAFANNTAVWRCLDKLSFQNIFKQIALRHTKAIIREELQLPPQKRVVITVPFTAIEEQRYTEMVHQMCDACWLTPEGNPIEEGRDASHPEVIERMREWLVRLRQTCLHAQVGRKNRRALGAKSGILRTINEVLEVMIDQNDSNWKTEAREMILNQIKMGHVKAYAGNVVERARSALFHYETALAESESYVKACREELILEQKKLGNTVAGNERLPSPEDLSNDEDDEKDGEHLGRISVLRRSLRSFLELEHVCRFFIATTYHQIKEDVIITVPDSTNFRDLEKLEVEWYEKAKAIRRELLRTSKSKAQQQMNKVKARKCSLTIPLIDDLPSLGGIEARKILEMMDSVSDYLNEQSKQVQAWRLKIIDILLMGLIDDDDGQEITGEEYDDSLQAQDELYVYILGLRTLVADRHAAVFGLQDALIEYELKAAEKQAARRKEEGERGHAPELMIEVANIRRKLQASLEGSSLKGIIAGVRSLTMTLQWKADGGDMRASVELDVVQRYLAKIQTISTQQANVITDLEKEQETFRSTMNQRLEYYRQFQHISDTVANWREDLDAIFDEREFNKYSKLRAQKEQAVATLKTKYTYLVHLRDENQGEGKPECVICQDLIEVGILTTCGHKYCKLCINTWWQQHHTCPLCKQKLRGSDFKNISLKPSESKAQEERHSLDHSTYNSSPHTSIYSKINTSAMNEIKMVNLDGSYGSKIDMIARHLIWIRNNSPGAKSIIFSQFGDFLDVLREALRRWKIGASSILEKDGIAKFKSDPLVEAFLLDAKSDSSGLNLVNATYVFLCEPLINPAIELQAIARVHRIGQQRATTVFMYLVSDTVEEAIYDISVARRLEHMGKPKASAFACASASAIPMFREGALDAANSKEIQAAPLSQLLRNKGDGEIVRSDDLWRCLFAKQKKPVKPVLEMDVGGVHEG